MSQTRPLSVSKPIKAEIDFREVAESLGTVVKHAAGNTIFREGDPPTYMYVVLDGVVEIASHGKLIETVTAGNAFGIVSMIDDMPRAATAKATEPSTLALIDRKKFRYMMEEIPNVVWFVTGELVRRIRMTNAAL